MEGRSKTRSENIVAQFNIIREEAPASKSEQFLHDYNHCPLCGTELVFTHVTQFVEGDVTEEAYCVACNIRAKSHKHSLQ